MCVQLVIAIIFFAYFLRLVFQRGWTNLHLWSLLLTLVRSQHTEVALSDCGDLGE